MKPAGAPGTASDRYRDVVHVTTEDVTDAKTGAGVMRNRCAFTPRDMGADWPEAFTYAVVAGWDDAMEQMATRWEWDPALVEFLSDAHRRFQELPDRNDGAPTRERREA